jgi:Fe2+ transport system protein B
MIFVKIFNKYFFASEISSFSSLNFFQLSQIKPADFLCSSFSSNNKKFRLEPELSRARLHSITTFMTFLGKLLLLFFLAETVSTPTVEIIKEKPKIVRTDEEIKAMNTKQYLDEMVVPTLVKGLSFLNKTVIFFLND